MPYNEQGNRGVDPKPERGNDQKGHKDKGNGPVNPPSRPTTPAKNHAMVDYGQLFTL
ncbi:hypothetical protein [Bacillus sp. AFS040349]|mgnify:CR=1 FL=1|uniref:hypothetical protein n=1 Tax=Bacillus sp. AFS040349 TaxID=2033502 RepID=UPI00159BA554|nr:hypothetical protein [Bacillus sp. AFS040349]